MPSKFYRQLEHLGHKTYNDYLLADHWRTFREKIFKQRGRRCEFCRDKRELQLHHKTYNRLGFEKEEDVVIVCDRCHEEIHELQRQIRCPLKIATEYIRLKKVEKPLVGKPKLDWNDKEIKVPYWTPPKNSKKWLKKLARRKRKKDSVRVVEQNWKPEERRAARAKRKKKRQYLIP